MTLYIAEAINQLHAFYGITAYEHPHGIVVSETDWATLSEIAARDRAARPHLAYSGLDRPFFGIPIFTAPDWTCDPYLLAQARLIATLARHRWFRILVWGGSTHGRKR